MREFANQRRSSATLTGRASYACGREGTPAPTDFGKFIADETEKWAKLIKFAGIKPE